MYSRSLASVVLTALVATLVALVPSTAHADPAAAPSAPIRYLSVPNGTSASGSFCSDATDPQGDAVTLAAVAPNPWALAYNQNACTFTLSMGGASGYTTVKYQLTDGTNVSDWLTIGVTFGKPGNAPVTAQPDSLATGKGLTLLVPDLQAHLLANDVDPEGATMSTSNTMSPETGGLLPGEDIVGASGFGPRAVIYKPPTGFVGIRRFTYLANDGTNSTLQSYAITITDKGPQKLPVANPDTYTVPKNGSITLTKANGVLANDTDADSAYIAVSGHTQALNGSLTGFKHLDGTWTYTPKVGFTGTDSFAYQVTDSEGNVTGYTTVTFSVKTMPPVAANDLVQVAKDTPLVIPFASLTANDTDVDSSFAITNVLPYTASTVVLDWAAKTLTYTPKAGWTGTDSVGYRLGDPDGNYSNWATVTVQVVPPLVNQAPIANADTYQVRQGQTLTVAAAQGPLANDTDFEGADRDVLSHTAPAHGDFTSFDKESGAFTYVPDAGWHGTESITYVATDPLGAVSANATITIEVLNDKPVANDDSYAAFSGVKLVVPAAEGVLVNDTDAEGEAVVGSSWSIPQHGQLDPSNDGGFMLTPDAGYTGEITFWYTIRDAAWQESDKAWVTITVTEAPVEPTPPPVEPTPPPVEPTPPPAVVTPPEPVLGEIPPATAGSTPSSSTLAVLTATRPTVRGKARVGRKVRAVAGVWGPAPVALTYQWLRNGKVIKTATASSYKLKAKDRGKRISVRVTGTLSGYAVRTMVSTAKRVR